MKEDKLNIQAAPRMLRALVLSQSSPHGGNHLIDQDTLRDLGLAVLFPGLPVFRQKIPEEIWV